MEENRMCSPAVCRDKFIHLIEGIRP
jgi:hypothetical protein